MNLAKFMDSEAVSSSEERGNNASLIVLLRILAEWMHEEALECNTHSTSSSNYYSPRKMRSVFQESDSVCTSLTLAFNSFSCILPCTQKVQSTYNIFITK